VLPVALVCPVCREALEHGDHGLACDPCDRVFPVIDGIPDLRVAPDPWIGLEDDRAKALRVLDEAEGLDFEGHVRAYWQLTPATATYQAERFVQHVLSAASRSHEWLSGHECEAGPGGRPWLDLGCGTADLAEAAGDRTVVGVDIAMRWLVIARRRLLDRGLPAHLVCANAEALPFGPASFSRALSLGMVEHCENFETVAGEAHRVLSPGAAFHLRTTNRFSILPEPHVGLWGVGFLPRDWADGYVRARGGQGYAHHRPPSARDLRRGLAGAGFESISVGAGRTLATEVAASGAAVRLTAPLYEALRGAPVLGSVLATISPLVEAIGTVAAGKESGDTRVGGR
jgi:SAM-dependent methyltransferase/uncharacterized protein YbaR (Trm112 family)